MANPFRRKTRALVASAATLSMERNDSKPSGVSAGNTRQGEAWRFYDEVPEVGAAGWYVSNSVGKLRLYAGVRVEADQAPTSVSEVDTPEAVEAREGERILPPGLAEAAEEELARIQSPQGGQSELLVQAALNLFVPGEFYTVGEPEQRDDLGRVTTPERWSVRSKEELSKTDRRWPDDGGPDSGQAVWEVKDDPTAREGRPLPRGTVLVRVWRPHPRWSGLADSSVLRLTETLADYQALSRSIRAGAHSATPAGLLEMAQEVDLPPAPNTDDLPPDMREQAAAMELYRRILQPIRDPSDPGSVAPIIVRVPSALVGKSFNRVSLGREIDKVAAEQRTELREVMAVCLDVPVEILGKRAQINHWGIWYIADETATAHTFPSGALIANAWTSAILHPALAARGFEPEDYERVVIWYDASGLVVRPNRAQDVKDAYDRAEASGEYLRDVLDIPETAKPSEEELAARIEWERARRSSAPAAPVGETQGPPATNPAQRRAVVAAVQPPGLDTLGRRLSRLNSALMVRLHGSADAHARKALDRAGARAKSRVASGGAQGRQFGAVYALVQGERNARLIPSLVGKRLLAAAGLTEDELLADAFADFSAQFHAWTATTRALAIADIRATTGMGERQAAEVAAALDAGTAVAAGALTTSLTALAAARLYDPDPNTPDVGEWDADVLVPLGLIRGALAIAGGGGADLASGGINPASGLPLIDGESPPLGFTLGPAVMGGLREFGVEPEGYTWEYGVSSRPFPPHAALDGVTFANFDDPVLANDGAFPPVAFFMPGDHAGCSCSAAPAFMVREAPAPEFDPTGEPLAAAGLNGHRR